MKTCGMRSIVRRQGGQAMVEMVAGLALVFVIGFLAMAMFGRLNDIRNKVLIGSRYVAWERTVWINPDDTGTGTDGWWYEKFGAGAQTVTKTDEVLRREFLARVVAPRRTSISGTDADMPLSAVLPPSWRDLGGTAFVRDRRDVMVSTRATDRMLGSLAKIANRPIGVYRSPHVEQEVSLLMASRTMQDGSVAVDVDLGGAFAQRLWPSLSRLRFQSTATLATNTWTPDGRLGVISAIGQKLATPTAIPDAMLTARDRQTLARSIDGVGDVLGPGYFKPGYVDTESVPLGALK